MDVPTTEVNKSDVFRLIRQQGYNIDGRVGYAFGLNVASKTNIRKFDGLPRREPVGALKKRDWNHIVRTSRSNAEAAERVIRVCLGKDESAWDSDPKPGMSEVDVEALVERRASEIADKRLREVLSEYGIDKNGIPTQKVTPKIASEKDMPWKSREEKRELAKTLVGPQGKKWSGRGTPPRWFVEAVRAHKERLDEC